MKSLLLKGYGQFAIEEMPRPEPGQQEVLVRVAACGICGSDVHGYDGSSGRRIPPLVMGHEAAGVIVAVGSGVTNYKIGDRVTFDSTVYCGQCVYCRRGEVNLCDRREVIGVSCGEYRRDGAFAEFVAVPERILYRLPSKLSFPEAAMLEAISVALHAVKVSEVKKGDTALVVGAGMIGLLTLQALRAAGVARVLIADIDETRLTLANYSAPMRPFAELAERSPKRFCSGQAALVRMRCSTQWGAPRRLRNALTVCARAER